MALQAFSLRRAQQTTGADPKLYEITPKNWRRFPPRIQDPTKVHVPTVGYTGGVYGDDIDTATALVTNDWTPKTQAEKATLANLTPGTELAKDVGAPRGSIEPWEPYPTSASPAIVAPVVASISPTTAPSASLPLMVTITGTGFTPFSTVYTGGANLPDHKGEYISPTEMRVPIWAAAPGTVSVAVKDHDEMSNEDVLFTVT